MTTKTYNPSAKLAIHGKQGENRQYDARHKLLLAAYENYKGNSRSEANDSRRRLLLEIAELLLGIQHLEEEQPECDKEPTLTEHLDILRSGTGSSYNLEKACILVDEGHPVTDRELIALTALCLEDLAQASNVVWTGNAMKKRNRGLRLVDLLRERSVAMKPSQEN